MLQVRDLTVEAGGRTLLSGVGFVVAPGDKVGLVGRNGAGKTTLLRALAGEAPVASGAILRKGAVGYLAQDPRGAGTDDLSALRHVLGGRGLDDAVARLERLRVLVEDDPSERNLHRFARAEEAFAAAGGYAAESEGKRILAGLGLRPDRADVAIGALSGGERRRVELGRILFAGADVLLLDEPTNHLDIDARTWLLGFLRSYRGALVVVSHDLALLDTSITRVLHLERGEDVGELIAYKGTYSGYLAARAADEERLGRIAARQEGEVQRLSRLADSMRHQTAKRARIAKGLDHRVARLRETQVEAPRARRSLHVRLPRPPRSGRTVLEADRLAKGFGGRPLFEDLSFSVGRGERLLVIGLNGAGKTTLLRILAAELEPDAGSARLGLGVSAGYYAQEHEGLQPGRSALDHVTEAADAPLADLRGVLGAFGLSGEIAHQDVATLSGGEKTRLALSLLVAGSHNLLLLDEPTNNLDPDSRRAVGEALAGWEGSMVVVSHDTEFVEELEPDVALILPDATIDRWSDDLAELVALA